MQPASAPPPPCPHVFPAATAAAEHAGPCLMLPVAASGMQARMLAVGRVFAQPCSHLEPAQPCRACRPNTAVPARLASSFERCFRPVRHRGKVRHAASPPGGGCRVPQLGGGCRPPAPPWGVARVAWEQAPRRKGFPSVMPPPVCQAPPFQDPLAAEIEPRISGGQPAAAARPRQQHSPRSGRGTPYTLL